MLRLSLPLLALLLLGPARADSLKRSDAVRNAVEKAVADGQVAGAVYLVSHKGKVVFEGSVGLRDLDTKKAMTTDTIFRIASMTKPITSVAAMILVEEGKLKLDDPVEKYIPEFKTSLVAVQLEKDGKKVWTTEKLARPITIRHLLTHTSGISYMFRGHAYLGALFVKAGVSDGISETLGTMADNVKRIATVPLFKQPGTAWEYGLNTDILGRVIEVVSRKTLGEFMRERIFAPLKMNDTHFLLPADKRSRLASVYGLEKAELKAIGNKVVTLGLLRYSATYPTWDRSKFQSGGGGLVSTAGDYHRFTRMLLNQGELDGKRILKAETIKEMTKDQLGKLTFPASTLGDRFGLGFGIETRKKATLATGSYSWAGLFYTFFWVDPENEICAVLMTQLYPSTGAKLRDAFARAVYAELKR